LRRAWLGTDATIHEHIKRVLQREYAIKQTNGLFVPSTLGIALAEAYDQMGLFASLTKPHLRRKVAAPCTTCQMAAMGDDLTAARVLVCGG
jgi:DNA topoisomerase IA